MDIGKVLEKAFKYPFKNKALWFYGILIAIFGGGSYSSNYTPDDGDYTQFESYLNTFNIDWSIFWFVIAVVLFIAVIFGIIGLIISSWSSAAIIQGVSQIESGKKVTRKEIGKTGKRTVWNIIVLTVFIPLAIIMALVAIAVPIIAVIAFLPSPINVTVGVIIGILAVFALIPLAVYFAVLWSLAPNIIVLEKKKAIESLKIAKQKIKGNFWITFALMIVTSIISGVVMIISIIPLLIIGGLALLFWEVALVAAMIFSILALLYLIFLIFIVGYLQAFTHTAWTVWWLDLNKLKGKK